MPPTEKPSAFKAPIYAFFDPSPLVEMIHGCHCEVFKCAALSCHCPTRFVRRFKDTKDSKSTGNLKKHVVKCWGEEAIVEAYKCASATDVRKSGILALGKLSQPIDMMFQQNGKGPVTYSHRMHTKIEAW